MPVRKLGLALTVAMLLGGVASANAATIWTPIPSGTNDTISSIVYQSPTRFWYATTNGLIAHYNGTGFTAGNGTSPGENFTDLAFQPGGPVGYAVTSTGHVWRSVDSGTNWSQLPALTTRVDCSSGAAPVVVSELNAVVWKDSTTVDLLGNNSTLEVSTNAASATPSFTEINKVGTGTCAAQSQTFVENLTDAAFVPSNPADGFLISQDFGGLYATSNGFVSGIKTSEMVNNFQGNPRLALDAANPNRLWAVDHAPGGGGCQELCLQFSTDGGLTETHATFPNDTAPSVGLYAITSRGGVEVTAGSGGEIFTSVDGSNFYLQPAAGALATENWRAADAYDAAHAAVGGANGALAITAAANTIPDIIAPTGSIAGPQSVTSGVAASYTAQLADNAGGSGINPSSLTWSVAGFPAQHGSSATFVFPRGTGSVTLTLSFADNAGNTGTASLPVDVTDAVTTPPPPPAPPAGLLPRTATVGGVSVTTFGVVLLVGRSGHYVPLTVTSHHARTILVSILSRRGGRQVGAGRLTLRHGGRRNLHVTVPKTIKPGEYIMLVRVTSLTHHALGRPLRRLFHVR